MTEKDYFSKQAATYAKFRPNYPEGLYQIVFDKVKGNEKAWDCGTGNGQVAIRLANDFQQVEATDISQKQLDQATPHPRIRYQVMKAETTSFAAHSLDLITVAQALHWFDFVPFFKEVHRVLKPDGIFAAWAYSLLTINAEIDPLIQLFYREIIGKYWPPERKHIDQEYAAIPFPFQRMTTHRLHHTFSWQVEHLLGYLNSWSSTQQYIQVHQKNPIDVIETELRALWGEELLEVSFPILLKLGQGRGELLT